MPSPERDKSPKRKLDTGNAPQCQACGSTTNIQVDIAGEAYQCKSDCKKEDNYGCGQTNPDGSKKRIYKLPMSERPIRRSKSYRIGILDSLPKLSDPQTDDSFNSAAAFMWWGSFRVTLKEPHPHLAPPPWMAEKNFVVVDNLDTDGYHFIIHDTTRSQAAIVYKGAYPAYRSLALLEPAKAWYHFGPVEDRYTLGVAVDILKQYCSAIAIVTNMGPCEWIEVPMDTFELTTADEIRGFINQAYADRDEELQKNVPSLI